MYADTAEATRGGLMAETAELEKIARELDELKSRLKDRIDPYELARIIDEERK